MIFKALSSPFCDSHSTMKAPLHLPLHFIKYLSQVMTFECCPDELGQQLLPLSCSSSNSQFQMILSCVHTSRHTEGWKSCTFKENTHTHCKGPFVSAQRYFWSFPDVNISCSAAQAMGVHVQSCTMCPGLHAGS